MTTAAQHLSTRARRILREVRHNGGEWTTHRAMRVLTVAGDLAPNRTVARTRARTALRELLQAGVFIQRDTNGRRCYIPATHLDGTR